MIWGIAASSILDHKVWVRGRMDGHRTSDQVQLQLPNR